MASQKIKDPAFRFLADRSRVNSIPYFANDYI